MIPLSFSTFFFRWSSLAMPATPDATESGRRPVGHLVRRQHVIELTPRVAEYSFEAAILDNPAFYAAWQSKYRR